MVGRGAKRTLGSYRGKSGGYVLPPRSMGIKKDGERQLVVGPRDK
jgi:hypothetical protein